LPAHWCSASSICQSSQAQNRFYTELEDWLSTTVYDQTAEPVVAAGGGDIRNAIERLRAAVSEAGGNKHASAAMSDLAKAVQNLVQQMRLEHQTIRDWVDSHQQGATKHLLQMVAREKIDS
jgi:hypothetical protein